MHKSIVIFATNERGVHARYYYTRVKDWPAYKTHTEPHYMTIASVVS